MRLVTVLLVLAIAGCQGDPQKCEQAVSNYASLVYWKQANKEIDAAPADQREAMRKDKLAELQAQLDKGLQTLVSQCTSANNKDQINCMIEAKTAEAAKACSGH